MATPTIQALRSMHCTARKGEAALARADAEAMLAELPGWSATTDGTGIEKTFRFADYHHTMAFVNAAASIAHREDHHPDLSVHYGRCHVHYSTHDVGGLSLNDFASAARLEDLACPA
jgi:4a-hydroxytetrahydrobiopterin dehydratase